MHYSSSVNKLKIVDDNTKFWIEEEGHLTISQAIMNDLIKVSSSMGPQINCALPMY